MLPTASTVPFVSCEAGPSVTSTCWPLTFGKLGPDFQLWLAIVYIAVCPFAPSTKTVPSLRSVCGPISSASTMFHHLLAAPDQPQEEPTYIRKYHPRKTSTESTQATRNHIHLSSDFAT